MNRSQERDLAYLRMHSLPLMISLRAAKVCESNGIVRHPFRDSARGSALDIIDGAVTLKRNIGDVIGKVVSERKDPVTGTDVKRAFVGALTIVNLAKEKSAQAPRA